MRCCRRAHAARQKHVARAQPRHAPPRRHARSRERSEPLALRLSGWGLPPATLRTRPQERRPGARPSRGDGAKRGGPWHCRLGPGRPAERGAPPWPTVGANNGKTSLREGRPSRPAVHGPDVASCAHAEAVDNHTPAGPMPGDRASGATTAGLGTPACTPHARPERKLHAASGVCTYSCILARGSPVPSSATYPCIALRTRARALLTRSVGVRGVRPNAPDLPLTPPGSP